MGGWASASAAEQRLTYKIHKAKKSAGLSACGLFCIEKETKVFFHKENQTIVEWYFKNKMNNGNIEEFDGISLIVWTENNKIMELKEFGCNLNTYNPYAQNDMPQFRDEKTKWFWSFKSRDADSR